MGRKKSQAQIAMLRIINKLEEKKLGLEPRLFDDRYYDEARKIESPKRGPKEKHDKTKGQEW